MIKWRMIRPVVTGESFHSYSPTSLSAMAIVLISLLQLSVKSKQQGILGSFTKNLSRGQEFTYTCCAKRNETIIRFRWGLKLYGSNREPFPLYSRTTVKGLSLIDNMWSTDFNLSKYKRRVEVTFNPKTLCMAWTISRVRKGDDNTFFAVYRDDSSLGKQFKPCNTTLRLVVDAREPFSTASTSNHPYIDLDTPPTKEGNRMTKYLDLDTPPISEGSYVTKEPTTDYDIEDTSEVTAEEQEISGWTIVAIVSTLAIIIAGIIATIYYNKTIRKWFNSARGRSRHDRDDRGMTRLKRSRKRLIRRRRTFEA